MKFKDIKLKDIKLKDIKLRLVKLKLVILRVIRLHTVKFKAVQTRIIKKLAIKNLLGQKVSAATLLGAVFYWSTAGAYDSYALNRQVLFDLDFSAGLHVGENMSTEISPTAAYEIIYGNPDIVSGRGGLDQALLLNTQDSDNGFEQIRLNVPTPSESYYFSADIYTEKLVGSDNKLSIVFEAEPVYSINFHGMGFIDALSPDKGSRTLKYLKDGRVLHLEVEFDAENKSWLVSIDRALVYESEYRPSTLTSVRISLAPWVAEAEETQRTNVLIDNIRLSILPAERAFVNNAN